MKPIEQEDLFGCAVACSGFVLNVNYQKSLRLFHQGKKKASKMGFLCKEIVDVLNRNGREYEFRYIKEQIKKKIYEPKTIVFIERSRKYPAGHYLARTNNNKWMDPWINFPSLRVKAGFRKRLPGKPIYVVSNLLRK